MLKPIFAFLSVISLNAFGQQLSHPVMASRDDLSYSPRPFLTEPDTVQVLAVMVQFQADDDPLTTGNGEFDLSPASDPIIDSPPRNGRFFRDHLTFLENYYQKASDAKQVIQSTLIDSVYTLSKEMGEYSPQRGESNLKLAELARDTWTLVDGSNIVIDYSSYDCFVIFHAGTGRDIDLVSVLGFDPTPRDVPSIFIGPGGFREEFGEGYPGIVVNGGQDTIWNSAILPETENRLIPTITGDFLLELSFNGLLCASVASYLGLPDLFDTNTGLSGIGRFGLMDGQGIFSFLGIFPPEPSAWEKYWLGWVDPLRVSEGETGILLPAVGLAQDDSLYRLPISAGEYFLLENRQRDPDRNGQTVTYVFDGTTSSRMFESDTIGFNAFDISALAGVITDVEDLDWSIPGGIDQDGTNLPGGVLIWHIDEAVIQREIGNNAVNANPDHRGVDVEEADGSQDIGQQYGFLSPGSGSEEGTPLDLWYSENPAPLFENEFSFLTFPSSRSNPGARSHIVVRDFSGFGTRMTAVVTIGDDEATPLSGFPRSLSETMPGGTASIGTITTGGSESMLVTTTGERITQYLLEGDSVVAAPTAGKVFGWGTDGNAAVPGFFSDGRIIEGRNVEGDALFSTSTTIADLDGDLVPEVILGQGGAAGSSGGSSTSSALRAFTLADTDGDSLADPFFDLSLPRQLTTPPSVSDSTIVVGAEGGVVYVVGFDGTLIDSVTFSREINEPPPSSVVGVSRSSLANGFFATGSDGTLLLGSSNPPEPAFVLEKKFGRPLAGPAASGIYEIDGQSLLRIAVTTTDGDLYLLDEQLNEMAGFPVRTGEVCSNPPALADIDGDGTRDVVMFSGNSMRAYNVAGVLLDNFPVTLNTGAFASAPIVADIDGDSDLDIIGVSEDGVVFGYDRSGEIASGFPLQAGTGRQSAAVIAIPSPSQSSLDLALVVASAGDGSVSAWKTGTIVALGKERSLPWPQYLRDPQNSGLAAEAISGAPVSSSFFPADRVYNWPNPVYDNTTFIRFFVGEDASVNVRIFDLAGDLVKEIRMDAIGGIDNEIPWDVSSVQSGIYFARVEASGPGSSGNAIVKVAVVK